MDQMTPPVHGPDAPAVPPFGQPAWTPEPPTGKRRIAVPVAAAAVAVVASGAIGFAWGQHSGETSAAADASAAAAAAEAAADARLTEAYDVCETGNGGTLDLVDDGTTIVVDTGSRYGSVAGLQCVLGRLDTPTSITAAIERTTSMMGVQSDTNDGLDYSWSYHPDNGVNMVITLAD